MDKKTICILVSMLMFTTALSVTGTELIDNNQNQLNNSIKALENRDMRDVQFHYPVGADTGSQYLVGIYHLRVNS